MSETGAHEAARSNPLGERQVATLIHFIKRCFHLPPEKLKEIEDFNLAPLGKSSAKRAERVDGDTEDLVKSKTRVRLT